MEGSEGQSAEEGRRADADERGRAGAADAIKESGPTHPRVDGHRDGAQFK